MDLTDEAGGELLYVGFNQDYGCFACGTSSGFRIYNTDPFRETFRRDFMHGGIGRVEMLFRCNILALVGGGPSPRYPADKVMVWDDHQNRCIGELSFRSEVRNVKLRRDRVVVVLSKKIYVYNFADLTMQHHVETVDNPRGLCAVSPASPAVLACPDKNVGQVRVEFLDENERVLIRAHESALACISLNLTGSRLATASEKGTLIRVFDTATGSTLQELRRGTDHADIYSIAFNPDASMLACTSDKGTCHVFKLAESLHDPAGIAIVGSTAGSTPAAAGTAAVAPAAAGSGTLARVGLLEGARADDGTGGVGGDREGGAGGVGGSGGGGGGGGGAASGTSAVARSGGGASGGVGGVGVGGGGAVGEGARGEPGAEDAEDGGNTHSSLSFLRGILPKYFSSEWSFAQFRVPDGKSICAFGTEPNTIIVISGKGMYFKANFEKGGEAVRVAYSPFVRSSLTGSVAP